MKKKWKKTGLLLILAGILGGSTVIWSAFSDSVSVRNRIQIGDVNIRLSEKELKDGKEIAYQDPKTIFPGDTISKIPMVTNLAEDCWIRARIRYRKSPGELEGFSDENLSGFSEKWVKRGDYFYYREVLKSGEAVDLFHFVKVPAEWTEEHAGQLLEIDIQTDAVQAANFIPDFDALSPWGNQQIELCIHEENGKVVSRKEQTQNVVEFNGIAHRLLAVPDDFFSGFGTAMPGDMLSDFAQISNTTGKQAEIWFRTGVENGDEVHDLLLQKLELTISMDGKQLYCGPLHAEKISKDISLIKLEPGQAGRLDFTVKVPAELGNAYALSRTDVKWVFTVHEEETGKDQTGTGNQAEITGASGAAGTTGAAGTDLSEVRTMPVKTEDRSRGLFWLSILLASAVMILFGAALQKAGGREK